MMQIKEIINPRYTESGAIDCEIWFEGMEDPVPYTATPDDTAETGQSVWQELQSGKWGAITPFTVTPELIAAAKDSKKREIEAWRAEQEAQPFVFEWNGRTWNAGPASMARLSPVAIAAKTAKSRETFVWNDASNEPVTMTMAQAEELAAVMAQAQLDRNDEIYQRQREMKDVLDELVHLEDIRLLEVA